MRVCVGVAVPGSAAGLRSAGLCALSGSRRDRAGTLQNQHPRGECECVSESV